MRESENLVLAIIPDFYHLDLLVSSSYLPGTVMMDYIPISQIRSSKVDFPKLIFSKISKKNQQAKKMSSRVNIFIRATHPNTQLQ